MALLKEDGSLDVERINKLPYEEYMDVMGELTQEQVEEYLSKSPINESKEPVKVTMVDYTLEEDINRNGAVILDGLLNKIKKQIGK
jgi:hypothetical protein